jgi:peptide/nickel transport system substrate-binding protein
MTAEDVVASVERWMKVSDRGRRAGEYVNNLSTPDDYTVVITLDKPFSELTTFLGYANAGAYIMPKEIVEAAGEQPVEEFIGTGPYMLDRWEVGNYVELARFEDYKARSEQKDKTAGKKVAYADSVRFVTVPEESTRLSGVKSGKYHVSLSISYDMYNNLLEDSTVRVELAEGALAPVFFYNHKRGIMTNKKMRQAATAAMDMEAIMKGTFGNEDLYLLGPNFSFTKESIFYSEAGSEYYNQADPEKAKRLLEEAGYDNEEIIWIAPTGYPEIYWPTVIAAEQLMNAGFNIKMEVIEAATFFGTTRPDPKEWDMFSTYHGFVPSPALWTVLSPSYPGWWENEEKDRLMEKYFGTFDIQERAEVWADVQQLIWDEAAIARTGVAHNFMVTVPELGGFEGMLQPILWNCWLEVE